MFQKFQHVNIIFHIKSKKQKSKKKKRKNEMVSISEMLQKKKTCQLTISGCRRWCRCRLQHVKMYFIHFSFLHNFLLFRCQFSNVTDDFICGNEFFAYVTPNSQYLGWFKKKHLNLFLNIASHLKGLKSARVR